jgi:hypothetical protein
MWMAGITTKSAELTCFMTDGGVTERGANVVVQRSELAPPFEHCSSVSLRTEYCKRHSSGFILVLQASAENTLNKTHQPFLTPSQLILNETSRVREYHPSLLTSSSGIRIYGYTGLTISFNFLLSSSQTIVLPL